MTCRHRAASCAENYITIDIAHINAARHGHQIEVYRFGGDNPPSDRSPDSIGTIAGEFHNALAAGLLNLNSIILDLYVCNRLAGGGIDMQIPNGSSDDKRRPIGNRAPRKTR